MQAISASYDSTNPDIDLFSDRGGKLLIVQGTTDMLVTHTTTTAYYNRLRSRYGAKLREFVRYYVQPGFGHGSGTFSMRWDALTALENWIEKGHAPHDQVATDANPQTAGRSRPLCEYPKWPKYRQDGDVNDAASFTCVSN